jgi:membrane protease YdiL (CAAX protease family)
MSFVKRYPQAVFWAIAWGTSFFGWYMGTRFPSDLWQLFIYGSFLGGLLVTAIADGPAAVKVYLKRIVKWRVGIQWYAVALLLPLALRTVAMGLNLATGAKMEAGATMPAAGDVIFEFLIILLIVALGEEPGFRGFALPRLMLGRSALAASLILGVLHLIWHAPLFVLGNSPWTDVPIILSGPVLITWLFNRTGGSVFLVMVMHAAVNLGWQFFSPLFTGAALQSQNLWLAVAYVAAAVVLPLLVGKELGRTAEAEMAPSSVRRAAAA